jgi:hypothetical protein
MTDPVGQNLYAVGGDTADGQPIFAYAEKISAEVGDPFKHKLVTRLIPRVEGSPGDVLQFRMGGQDFFGQPVRWNAPVDFTIGTSVAVSDIVEGRLISFRVEATTAKPWILHSHTLHVVEQAEF